MMKPREYLAIAAVFTIMLAQAPLVISADMSALPPARTQNGITYITGGIGQPESTVMREAGKDYDLMMTFAKANGAFLSDVRVDIMDQRGSTVLTLVSDPILLANLPSGTYKIRASFAGELRERTVKIGRGHDRLAYTWPNSVDPTSNFAAFERAPSQDSTSREPRQTNPPIGSSEMR